MQIQSFIKEAINVHETLLKDNHTINNIRQIVDVIVNCYENNGKVLLCGNGGSAADAQHIAAELTGRFKIDRAPLNAEALHCNTSFLTAVSNDNSFDYVYERMIEATANQKDVLMAFSTSGNSKNIINALRVAKKNNIYTIGFSGQSGGQMAQFCDITVNMPSENTPRIQEAHILTGHIICELVEKKIFCDE